VLITISLTDRIKILGDRVRVEIERNSWGSARGVRWKGEGKKKKGGISISRWKRKGV